MGRAHLVLYYRKRLSISKFELHWSFLLFWLLFDFAINVVAARAKGITLAGSSAVAVAVKPDLQLEEAFS